PGFRLAVTGCRCTCWTRQESESLGLGGGRRSSHSSRHLTFSETRGVDSTRLSHTLWRMRPGGNGAKAAAVEKALARDREPALPPCKCGCGQTVRKAGQRYVFGHQHKGGSKGKG